MAADSTHPAASGPGCFAGRTAFITGADSLAAAIATSFAAGGGQVHVCDVRAGAVAALCQGTRGISGSVADVGTAGDVRSAAIAALQHLGHVDFLFNVVGISGPTAWTEDISDADWQRTLAVNVGGIFHTAREFIPGMKARGFGAIVNISTASTIPGLPMRSAYIASKYAVEGLTRNLARELGPHGVRCNALRPGAMNNERLRGIFAAKAQQAGVSLEQAVADALRFHAIPEMVELEEVAAMALYLCTPAARRITGQLIGVDGAMGWEE